jgi:hypothetical protein
MITLEKLPEIVFDAIRNENRLLFPNHILSLPETALSTLIGAKILAEKDKIFSGPRASWELGYDLRRPAANSLLFVQKIADFDDELLIVACKTIGPEENLNGYLEKVMPHARHTSKLVLCLLLKADAATHEKWVEKWVNAYAGQLSTLGVPVQLVLNGHEEERLWLHLWQAQPMREEAGSHKILEALTDAVANMSYENMLFVLKKIISLRTDMQESQLVPELMLSTLFKMVFAREQGVPLQEVYDPIAFGGYTDSQLAARNLLDDMQKTFNVDFAIEESITIRTIGDLANAILEKKAVQY